MLLDGAFGICVLAPHFLSEENRCKRKVCVIFCISTHKLSLLQATRRKDNFLAVKVVSRYSPSFCVLAWRLAVACISELQLAGATLRH